MATSLSLSYRERSHSEGIHELQSQIWPAQRACCRSAKVQLYILSLKIVWNGVLYLMPGCKATQKKVS